MRVVDLFCGCGGMSLGLLRAGLDVVCGVDNWRAALSTYRRNFTHPALCIDLSKVDESVASLRPYLADVVVGGPPCQDFSSAGRRDEEGGRGILTECFALIAIGLQPEWIVMENVSTVLRYTHPRRALQMLQEAGYGISHIVLNAALCGVPQRRKRFFCIARRGKADGFLDSLLTHSLSNHEMTVREYFRDVLCEPIDVEFYYRHPRSYARRGVYSVDEPSATIRGVNRPVPPNYQLRANDPVSSLNGVKPLTTSQRALIQTFPADFEWVGSRSEVEQMIGNAVPCGLAEFVGRVLVTAHSST